MMGESTSETLLSETEAEGTGKGKENVKNAMATYERGSFTPSSFISCC